MDIVIRAEYRTEQRTTVTPVNAERLVKTGCKVYIEKSDDRVFPLQQYIDAGCIAVDASYWQSTDPATTLVVGLKELPENIVVSHTMSHFQHCLKGQTGSEKYLQNFRNGMLYDIEYFTDSVGRRLLSFSHNAGYVGAALSVFKWLDTHFNTNLFNSYKSSYTQQELADIVNSSVQKSISDSGFCFPRVIIIGAKGKCGKGSLDFFTRINMIDNVTQWDIEETKIPGPYPVIMEHDILINTILLPKDAQTNHFVTSESLMHNKRLSVIVDVSCDVHSLNNVLPINMRLTTLQNPFYEICKDVYFCAVDNLPSLVPKDASEQFSDTYTDLLLEYLQSYATKQESDIWRRCGEVFIKAIHDIHESKSVD